MSRWRLGEEGERTSRVTRPLPRPRMALVRGGARSAAYQDEGESGTIERFSRPRTRGDCVQGIRPCPWVSCRHHLYLDVHPNGTMKVNHPEKTLEQMADTCSLDVADREGGITLEETGRLMNVTRERIRQIEARVLKQVRDTSEPLRDMMGDGFPGERDAPPPEEADDDREG